MGKGRDRRKKNKKRQDRIKNGREKQHSETSKISSAGDLIHAKIKA